MLKTTGNSKLTVLIWITLFGVMLFAALNRHSKSGVFTYKSQIYGDKAGYYVYLPATFIYHFDAPAFPDSVGIKTGNGFLVDMKNNKIRTKYNYGVALMQTPFFLTAHFLAKPLGFKNNGFSLIYNWAVDVSAVFYLVLGSFFLFRILSRRFPRRTALLTLFFVVAGTNVFYYATVESGMSHIYSFSLVALFYYLAAVYQYYSEKQILFGIAMGFMAGLIVVIRPLNVILVIAAFFIGGQWKDKWQFMLQPRFLSPFLISGFVALLPQMIYWKYLSGSWINNTYAGETFSNWEHPRLLAYFFAPHNGMFIYNPLLLIIVAGIILMILHKKTDGYITAVVFILVSYLISSWWMYYFGCGFASRNMVDYMPLFAIPLAWILSEIKNKKWKNLLLAVALFFTIYNIKIIYSYSLCWYGTGDWDWHEYLHLLLQPMH